MRKPIKEKTIWPKITTWAFFIFLMIFFAWIMAKTFLDAVDTTYESRCPVWYAGDEQAINECQERK